MMTTVFSLQSKLSSNTWITLQFITHKFIYFISTSNPKRFGFLVYERVSSIKLIFCFNISFAIRPDIYCAKKVKVITEIRVVSAFYIYINPREESVPQIVFFEHNIRP